MGDTFTDILGGIPVVGQAAAGIINAIQTGDNNRENREFTAQQNAISREESWRMANFNANQAAIQREFQMMMSNTAHQREMRDLEAAGLNPILAANKGADSMSGAMGTGSAASMQTTRGESQRLGDAVAAASSSAMQAMQMRKSFEATDAAINVDKAKTVATLAEADKNATTATGQRLTNQIMRKQMPVVAAQAEKDVGQASWDKNLQSFDNILRRASDTGAAILDLVNPINAVRRGLDYKYQRPQQPGVPYPPGSPGRHSYMNRKKP